MSEFRKNISIPLMILCVPFVLYATYRSLDNEYSRLPYYSGAKEISEATAAGSALYPFSLVTADEKSFTRSDLSGKITVFNFFFATCTSICPRMLENETRLADAFAGNAGVKLVSITVDPENDTPELLKEFRKNYRSHNAGWEFLTGRKQEIYRFARKGLNVVVTDGDGGPDDFIHSDLLVLVDQKGRVRGYYRGTDEQKVTELIRDIHKLQSISS